MAFVLEFRTVSLFRKLIELNKPYKLNLVFGNGVRDAGGVSCVRLRSIGVRSSLTEFVVLKFCNL